ncbi:hypothetical protein EAH89_19525 [Roseomonas nepalensis]|uniref:Uncharacterized protein n=1 Tax=Muricoccus nepalensis TaxID=1854500 RepID=A0A502FRZ3_9PROT|nr:hypothetical protein EAH89_19525 [Roseomonas nepalensis]
MTTDLPEPVRRGQEAMGRPVGDFAAPAGQWALFLQCAGSCRVQRRLVADLVPLIPPDLTWAEVVPKLRCSQCGASASIVGLSGPPRQPGLGSTWLLLQWGKGAWRN